LAHKTKIEFNLSENTFLVTGGAGFIGSNIVKYLVENNAKRVVVLDNLSTGYLSNIEPFIKNQKIDYIQGDICDVPTCEKACEKIDFVLHQAALGSVPRSIKDPVTTNKVNVTGFLNILIAAKNAEVKKFIYASSSSVYGSDTTMPKVEQVVGDPLSPYAVSKKTNELYAKVFFDCYGFETIGLRYFNIFGPNQSPSGQYAALIPKFIKSILGKEQPTIFGDGEQARDFTYIDNAVQANIKAIFASKEASGKVFNIAYGAKTSVNELFSYLKETANVSLEANYGDLRPGEIKDSLADISLAREFLKYEPQISVKEGLSATFEWFLKNKEVLI
jgi:UDP-N-acetylglucosamine/UDP-N-acetylgalactosamine 4-epimerase